METKHTPGPWNDGMDSKGNFIYMQRYGDPYLRPEDINEEWQANLRLVSSAPDLLEALNELANGYSGNRWDVGIALRLKKARAAIAKATGA